jgi:hypothetical protein
MDWQTVINIGLGGVLAALGWFAREIWDSLKETARFDKLESLIGSLYDRLNDKADK